MKKLHCIIVNFVVLLLIMAISYSYISSRNNQLSSLVDNEIAYLNSRIDTIQILFMQDKSNSSLRPSQHLKDLSMFNEIFFELIPWSSNVWADGISNADFFDRVEILLSTISTMDIDNNVKDELNNLFIKYKDQKLDYNVAYLEFKRIELSILLDLYIKQNVYKETTS